MAEFMFVQQDPLTSCPTIAAPRRAARHIGSWPLLVMLLFGLGWLSTAKANYLAHDEVTAFIQQMVREEGFRCSCC